MNSLSRPHRKHESWISIQSLKEATDIKFAFQSQESSFSSNSGCASPDTSVNLEPKPNMCTTSSFSFKRTFLEPCDCPLMNNRKVDQFDIISGYFNRKELRIQALTENYEEDIRILKTELEKTKGMLKLSQNESKTLNETIVKMKYEHFETIENLQARHEQKRHKSRVDFDSVLSEMNSRTTRLVSEKMNKEFGKTIYRIHENFEKQLKDCKTESAYTRFSQFNAKGAIVGLEKELCLKEKIIEDQQRVIDELQYDSAKRTMRTSTTSFETDASNKIEHAKTWHKL